MRKLLWVLVSISVLWGGYWFVGSNAVEKGLTVWLAETSGSHWDVKYSTLNTRGFPNRFDTTVRDIKVTGQDSNIVWSAPFFQIFALSYKPNHIIAVWPNNQKLTLLRQRLTVDSSRMRGSIVFKPETALTLDRSALEINDLDIKSNFGWSVAATALQLNTRQSAKNENDHDVFISADNLKPPARIAEILDPDRDRSKTIDLVKFEGLLAFDGPWDRRALEQAQPNLNSVSVSKLHIQWDELDVSAAGHLAIDARGFLEGELEITATKWRDIYQILERFGLIQENFSGAIESILTLMALETDNPDVLVAKWVFQGGTMRFGAIPLGAAPRLTHR